MVTFVSRASKVVDTSNFLLIVSSLWNKAGLHTLSDGERNGERHRHGEGERDGEFGNIDGTLWIIHGKKLGSSEEILHGER